MNRDKLTPIELECNMGKDINGVEHRELWKAYDIDEVDALLAKKDKEIYNIKYSRDKWVKACNQKDKEIAELKQKLEDVNELIKTARKMLEDAKATAYAESVDAGMRERKLRRLLWHARAERAKYRVEYWSCRGGTLLEHYPFCVNGDSPFNRLSEMGCLYGETNERLKEAKFKHLYSSEWMIVWGNVERKCRAKAEEYK